MLVAHMIIIATLAHSTCDHPHIQLWHAHAAHQARSPPDTLALRNMSALQWVQSSQPCCRDDELHDLQHDFDPGFLDSLLEGTLEEGDGAAGAFGGSATADDGSLTWDELMAGLDDLPHMRVSQAEMLVHASSKKDFVPGICMHLDGQGHLPASRLRARCFCVANSAVGGCPWLVTVRNGTQANARPRRPCSTRAIRGNGARRHHAARIQHHVQPGYWH